jgi:hypothetical protein
MMSENKRKSNPWVPAGGAWIGNRGLSGFNVVGILNLLIMGFGAYFLISKANSFFGKYLTSGEKK